MNDDVTEDGFLGGRITAAQPKHGFRAGHDTVLLAAAVPAKAGERVLELGSGAGIASLCLAARVPGVEVVGCEIDAELVALANANAERNGMTDRVRFVVGDVLGDIAGAPFDHVFFNPPFHPDTGQASPSVARDRAMRGDDVSIFEWTRAAWGNCSDRFGTVTAILRADRIGDVRANELEAGYRAVAKVLPLAPRAGVPPKRAIVQLLKGDTEVRQTLQITNLGFVLHERDGLPTAAAEAVLRHAAPLVI